MSFDELIENLIYSASVSVTIPNRPAPDSLRWAHDRLRDRYGSLGLGLEMARSSFERGFIELRRQVTAMREELS